MSASVKYSIGESGGGLLHTGVYLRESTDNQRYSSENQMKAISAYALVHRMRIVRIYSDAGRSGLTLRLRSGFQEMLRDVLNGTAGFSVLLLYDVSRWGRFQDIDESAHLEFICRQAGVTVEYCAEEFANNLGLGSTLMKGVKRAMAAEYSRELSARTSRGLEHIARLGFHAGGYPVFGLRRMLVDEAGVQKGILLTGQQKYFKNDRVILVPGPPEEVSLARLIFRLFADHDYTIAQIRRTLAQRNFTGVARKTWTKDAITYLLQNESLAGISHYNRSSAKLGQARKLNPREMWIRRDGVIEPVIDRDLFERARAKLDLSRALSDIDILNFLTATWCVHGSLSPAIMASNPRSPCHDAVRKRFGSLTSAYERIGYRITHHFKYGKHKKALEKANRKLLAVIVSLNVGGKLQFSYAADTEILHDDQGNTVQILFVLFKGFNGRGEDWWLERRAMKKCDYLLIARMRKSNSGILDLHLLPPRLFERNANRLNAEVMAGFARYRVSSPGELPRVLNEYVSP